MHAFECISVFQEFNRMYSQFSVPSQESRCTEFTGIIIKNISYHFAFRITSSLYSNIFYVCTRKLDTFKASHFHIYFPLFTSSYQHLSPPCILQFVHGMIRVVLGRAKTQDSVVLLLCSLSTLCTAVHHLQRETEAQNIMNSFQSEHSVPQHQRKVFCLILVF